MTVMMRSDIPSVMGGRNVGWEGHPLLLIQSVAPFPHLFALPTASKLKSSDRSSGKSIICLHQMVVKDHKWTRLRFLGGVNIFLNIQSPKIWLVRDLVKFVPAR